MARKKRFTSFEQLAQRFVEGSFSRLLGGQFTALEAATQLHRVLEDREQQGLVVSVCRLRLHPGDMAQLARQHADVPSEVLRQLVSLMKQSGLTLAVMPALELIPDPDLSPHQVQIDIEEMADEEETTQIFKVRQTASAMMADIQALDAFLIVNGRQHVSLNQPVTNLGRRDDNDVVLDSPTVSRRHAQIRWRYGRFVLYDLGSRVGTRLNGRITQESVLTAGDVIGLSGETLIYAEGLMDDGDITLAFRPRLNDEQDAA